MVISPHAWPMLFVGLLWFVSTGAIIWLDNLPRRTFRWSMAGAGMLAGIGIWAAIASAADTSAIGAYVAFAAATAIWGWHEMSFLMGYVAGPNRLPEAPGLTGWARFKSASATLIHHEIALVATGALLYALVWGQPNRLAADSFALLYLMRLSTKLNIFLGVANLSTDIMPAHLTYLKSYFRTARMNPLFPVSAAASAWLCWLLWAQGMAAPANSGAAVAAMMLFTLAAVALLEHLFIMLPLRDSALWRWAHTNKAKAGGSHGL
jgi:putative photosynthetic complex assembly protein 2